MKNTPITARVKSGMFKTKEPLLNVGPAGVDGNNKTRTMPSPSKMKGYAMKSSPFKQEKTAAEEAISNETALSSGENNSGVKSEKTKIIRSAGERIKGKEITKTGDFDTNWDESKYGPYAEWIKKPGNKAKEDKFIESKQEGTGKFEPDTVGPDKETKVTQVGDLYKKSTGKSQTAYARRNNARAGRRTDREVNNFTRKQGKYGTYDQEGKFTQRKDLSQREIRKLGIAQRGLKRAKQESENAYQQSKQNVSGVGGGKDVLNLDRKATLGDYDLKTEQPDIATKTTPKKNPFTTKKVNTDIGFEAGEVKSGFFKKKSPMKMNYFKK